MVADSIYDSSSRGSDPLSSGLSQHQAPMLVHLHRRHKSHTQKKKNLIFFFTRRCCYISLNKKQSTFFFLKKSKFLKSGKITNTLQPDSYSLSLRIKPEKYKPFTKGWPVLSLIPDSPGHHPIFSSLFWFPGTSIPRSSPGEGDTRSPVTKEDSDSFVN